MACWASKVEAAWPGLCRRRADLSLCTTMAVEEVLCAACVAGAERRCAQLEVRRPGLGAMMIGGDPDLGRAQLCVVLCWHSEAELGEAEASRCIRLRRVELLRLCTTEAVLRCTALRICAMAERLMGRHLEDYKRTPWSSDARGKH
ncbi:hypothetical protein Taro_004389 [Colocasia esculenta]|uniref:Uncharacterized protein n=1 Tax=Colocasia esculenta TaxID=4460 RepID=A0A843TM74_COLES|nr:hypothetical protein [Colocasia esculenta]